MIHKLETINRYIRRCVDNKNIDNAYNNCMYILDLRVVDENMSISIDEDLIRHLDMAKEIVSYYCDISKQLNDAKEINIDVLYRGYDMFHQINISSDEEYRKLIEWPLSRMRNQDNVNKEKYKLYFNMMLRRTSEYLSFGIKNRDKMFRFIELIINQMSSNYDKTGVSKKFIDEYKNKKCVAVAKIEYKRYGKIEYGIAFSGFWDNASIVNKFNPDKKYTNDKNEKSFKELYLYIIKKIEYNNIDTDKMIWCRIDYNQVSYSIHPVTGTPYRLSDFKKDRFECCRKHFSCCERKILANIHLKKIDNLKIHVTKKPCIDCEKAIKDINSRYRKSFITVNWKQDYKDTGHSCGKKYKVSGSTSVS